MREIEIINTQPTVNYDAIGHNFIGLMRDAQRIALHAFEGQRGKVTVKRLSDAKEDEVTNIRDANGHTFREIRSWRASFRASFTPEEEE